MTSNISNTLWKEIEDFDFGLSESSLTFADRLARENGWDARYAEQVIEEYRRFCFLAMTAGHPVTPSEQVDQAWHLHLLYTENYWTEFCGQVLGRPFHHGPTRGGPGEGSKFHDWYRATLDSYERVFGEAPPPAIWPDPEARFQDAHRFRRINTASHWVIPKPDGPSLRRWLLPAMVLPILGACALTGDGRGAILAGIGGVVALLVLVGFITDRSDFRRRRRKARSKDGGDSGCSGGASGWWFWGSGGGHSDDTGGGDGGCGSSGCGGGGCGGGCGN